MACNKTVFLLIFCKAALAHLNGTNCNASSVGKQNNLYKCIPPSAFDLKPNNDVVRALRP